MATQELLESVPDTDGVVSGLYQGRVRHRRFSPIEHQLNYPISMWALDLDKLSQLEQSVTGFGFSRWHWARFKRSDYCGEGDLKTALIDKVVELASAQSSSSICSEPMTKLALQLHQGKVVALVHLRYLGLYFSPVNFYYFYDAQGDWRYLLAEVSNTPWHEKHYYLIPTQAEGNLRHWQQQKAFHVSPFNPMDQEYQWCVRPLGERASIYLACHRIDKEFDASLQMRRQPLNSQSLRRFAFASPMPTISLLFGIYWQAFKLWRKGAVFYSHPKYQKNKDV
jgi:DUF1365 family protein